MKKNALELEKYIEKLKCIVGIETLDYSKNEIENISNMFLEKKLDEDLMYYYIGEAYINLISGKWKMNNIRKDPAFGRMCIVDWTKGATRIDPMTILNQIKSTNDNSFLYNSIESTKKNIIEINNILKDLNLNF